jgi:hypothetical protein
MRLGILFSITLSTIFCAWAQIQSIVNDTQGNGNVDWTNHCIIATGIGSPNPDLPQAAQQPAALRAAQQSALNNALETVKGIYFNSNTIVKNFMIENDMISSNVNSYLQGLQQQENQKLLNNGAVEITMNVPLDGVGGIGDMLLGNSVAAKPAVSSFEKGPNTKEVVYTGLIINCKKLSVKPALSPRILDENDREVFGNNYVSRDWAIKYGIVGYAKGVQDAQLRSDRIGNNPGVINARKAAGNNSTDIIIANKDAEKIRSTPQNLKFMAECRVIFVID